MFDSPKMIPHVQDQRRSPNKMVGRVEITFRIKLQGFQSISKLSSYFLVTCSDWGQPPLKLCTLAGTSLTARKHQANVGLKSASL